MYIYRFSDKDFTIYRILVARFLSYDANQPWHSQAKHSKTPVCLGVNERFNFGVSEVVSFCTDLQLYVVWEGFWTFLE